MDNMKYLYVVYITDIGDGAIAWGCQYFQTDANVTINNALLNNIAKSIAEETGYESVMIQNVIPLDNFIEMEEPVMPEAASVVETEEADVGDETDNAD